MFYSADYDLALAVVHFRRGRTLAARVAGEAARCLTFAADFRLYGQPHCQTSHAIMTTVQPTVSHLAGREEALAAGRGL